MNKQKQNEACCKALGWRGFEVCEKTIRLEEGLVILPFTQNDTMVRLLRAKVIGAAKAGEFVRHLNLILFQEGCDSQIPVLNFMQATPAQQVEAALRALGKWESE